MQEKSFKDIFIQSSGGPFIQRSGMICAILVVGITPQEQLCEIILNLDQCFRKSCHFKDFFSTALSALMFGEAEPFMQFW